MLKDAGITITKSDVKDLEEKPKYGYTVKGARTQGEEKQMKLCKKNMLAMAHLTMSFGTKALLNKLLQLVQQTGRVV